MCGQECEDCKAHINQITELERQLHESAAAISGKHQIEERLEAQLSELQNLLAEQTAQQQQLVAAQAEQQRQLVVAQEGWGAKAVQYEQAITDLEGVLAATTEQQEGLEQGLVHAGQLSQQYIARAAELESQLQIATEQLHDLQAQLAEARDDAPDEALLGALANAQEREQALQNELSGVTEREAALLREAVCVEERETELQQQIASLELDVEGSTVMRRDQSRHCEQLQAQVEAAKSGQRAAEEQLENALEQLDYIQSVHSSSVADELQAATSLKQMTSRVGVLEVQHSRNWTD